MALTPQENPRSTVLSRITKTLVVALAGAMGARAHAQWAPASVPISSPWAASVTPTTAWPEYPRPQMVRDRWTNLNGLWRYAVTSSDVTLAPDVWEGEILVPYSIESSLSGVGRRLERDDVLWYRRSFHAEPVSGRLLLNFEAVDYACTVWVNNIEVGAHTGGSLPFSFDVTEAVRRGENDVVVRVVDQTDDRGHYQLRGKQARRPGGIWYTPVSGIWQTVWLEEVPEVFIESLRIDTQIDPATVTVTAGLGGRQRAGQKVRVRLLDREREVSRGEGRAAVTLPVDDAVLWSPDTPHLYGLEIELIDIDGGVIDRVESYAGIREVGEAIGAHGKPVFTLNGEEIFHWGPLDQGWWPESLLTPPSAEAMRFDIDYLKSAGFNMIRKHIKVEPRRYYAYCDRVGMLVWQDQVSGGHRKSEWPEWRRLDRPGIEPDVVWPDWAHRQYMSELRGMIDTLYNHPSIVCWVPFNERWGQHKTLDVGRWVTDYDPSRHINIASGGNFWPIGDIVDQHQYPDPAFPWDEARFDQFVRVIGEFGGHAFPVEGHRWQEDGKNWGYGGIPENEEEFQKRLRRSLEILAGLKSEGIAAAVYTQTSDVEIEINGLMTYDRRVVKVPADELRRLTTPLREE